ncbi:hypothetical protein DQG13_23000 [Paenibacillus sp. YN15]|nr:hypothetical protein DQG13_23000 [Paenibacillus sp. YN15]
MLMHPIRQIGLGLAIVLALTAVPANIPPVLAAEGQAQVQHVPEDRAEASISLGEGRTLEIAGARVFGQGGSLLCTFEAVIANDSGSDLALRDYYFAVRTPSGEAVDFKLLPEDRNRLTVPAGTTAAYRFYGAVGSEAEARGLRLEANRWDFSLAGLYAKLGEAGWKPTVGIFHWPAFMPSWARLPCLQAATGWSKPQLPQAACCCPAAAPLLCGGGKTGSWRPSGRSP